MWPFKEKVRQRRLEIRRSVGPARKPLRRRFRDAGGPAAALVATAFYLVVLLLDVRPLEPLGFRPGQHVGQDIRARVDFPNPAAQAAGPEQPSAETPASFTLDKDLLERLRATLEALPDKPATRPATQPAPPPPTPEELFGPGGLTQYKLAVPQLLAGLRKLCILSAADAQRQVERNAEWHLHGGADVLLKSPQEILAAGDENAPDQLLAEKLQAKLEELCKPVQGAIGRAVLAELENTFLDQKRPLYVYDPQRTKKESVVKAASAMKVVQKGKVIVPASRVKGINSQEFELLAAEHEAYKADLARHPWRVVFRGAGRALFLLGVVLAMCAYVVKYDRSIAKDVRQALRVAATAAVLLAAAKIMTSGLDWRSSAIVLPAIMGGMIMAVAYDQRFAQAIGFFLALLAALQVRAGVSDLMVVLTGVAAAVFQLREIRTRTKLLVVSTSTAAAVFAMVWAHGMFSGTPAQFLLADAGVAALFAVAAGILIQVLLPAIERFFRVATATTLLEWCDASRPLLRHLAMQAPGTYNHSLQFGAICESAAEAIGAKGLLARAGAYYHDIGKINKSEYFVENQAGSASKHARLSPAMSLLIITGHVKDGLELAKEYGLPKVLRQFIGTHHGTTLVQYFYQAAAEQRKNAHETAPDEIEFRYAGPKPRSKEAAILMLADAAESSVRSMADPTPGRIDNQVHAMVMRRLMDGQLDECDLTLKEVHAIEASLVRSLCGMYHSRISYPTPAGQEPSAAERAANRPAPTR